MIGGVVAVGVRLNYSRVSNVMCVSHVCVGHRKWIIHICINSYFLAMKRIDFVSNSSGNAPRGRRIRTAAESRQTGAFACWCRRQGARRHHHHQRWLPNCVRRRCTVADQHRRRLSSAAAAAVQLLFVRALLLYVRGGGRLWLVCSFFWLHCRSVGRWTQRRSGEVAWN